MKFYIGLHIPAHAGEFENSFISINVLKNRCGDIFPQNWIMDSAAFSQVEKFGNFLMSPFEYVNQINRWSLCGNLIMAVSQDYMCEEFILKKWGRTVKEHQKMTVERYYQIIDQRPTVYVLPVLQGYTKEEYLKCADMYDFPEGSYFGIGSVCKRNKNVEEIRDILKAVKEYTGFKLHGFGIKKTALMDPECCKALESSDSMAWSYQARAESDFTWPNRANDWTYAMQWYQNIRSIEGVS